MGWVGGWKSRVAVNRPAHALGALFDSFTLSPDPVFVTDRFESVVFWNEGAERLLGYAPEEIIGSSCAEKLAGCDAFGNRYCSENCPITQMANRGDSVRHFGLRLRSRDGVVLRFDVAILHLAVPPPDRFYLAHILIPSDAPDIESPAPHRSAMIAVRESPDARARKLTAREVEVLGMLAAGRTTPEIADRLHISALTARNHTQNILDKLELHSKAEAVAFAFQKGLI